MCVYRCFSLFHSLNTYVFGLTTLILSPFSVYISYAPKYGIYDAL